MRAKKVLENHAPGEAEDMPAHQPASSTVDDTADTKQGERDGRHWAMFRATAPQLAVLAAELAEHPTWPDVPGPNGLILNLMVSGNVGSCFGQDFVDDPAYRDVLRGWDRDCSPAYVRGLVRAAVAVWAECQAEI